MILSNPNASAALSLVLVSRDDRQAYDDNHGAEKVSENCAEEYRSSHSACANHILAETLRMTRPVRARPTQIAELQ